MEITEKYKMVFLALDKIAKWDSDFHHMTKEESFNCCQNIARSVIKKIENETFFKKSNNDYIQDLKWQKLTIDNQNEVLYDDKGDN